MTLQCSGEAGKTIAFPRFPAIRSQGLKSVFPTAALMLIETLAVQNLISEENCLIVANALGGDVQVGPVGKASMSGFMSSLLKP